MDSLGQTLVVIEETWAAVVVLRHEEPEAAQVLA